MRNAFGEAGNERKDRQRLLSDSCRPRRRSSLAEVRAVHAVLTGLGEGWGRSRGVRHWVLTGFPIRPERKHVVKTAVITVRVARRARTSSIGRPPSTRKNDGLASRYRYHFPVSPGTRVLVACAVLEID